jgi:hypothetical protein
LTDWLGAREKAPPESLNKQCVAYSYRSFAEGVEEVLAGDINLSNYINSQLDATIIIVLIISISSTCFGRKFRPSSGALDCVYSLWY